MADAGIDDLLIANQIVGTEKIRRLMALCERADPVAIDHPTHIAALSAGGPSPDRPLRLVVEVNVGMNRAGLNPVRRRSGSLQRLRATLAYASSD